MTQREGPPAVVSDSVGPHTHGAATVETGEGAELRPTDRSSVLRAASGMGPVAAIVGGVLMVVGCSQPCLAVTTMAGPISADGFSLGLHGELFAIIGALTVLDGVSRFSSESPRLATWLPAIGGLVAIAVLVVDYGTVEEIARNLVGGDEGSRSVAYGFMVVGLGAIIAIVSALLPGPTPRAAQG